MNPYQSFKNEFHKNNGIGIYTGKTLEIFKVGNVTKEGKTTSQQMNIQRSKLYQFAGNGDKNYWEKVPDQRELKIQGSTLSHQDFRNGVYLAKPNHEDPLPHILIATSPQKEFMLQQLTRIAQEKYQLPNKTQKIDFFRSQLTLAIQDILGER